MSSKPLLALYVLTWSFLVYVAWLVKKGHHVLLDEMLLELYISNAKLVSLNVSV